MEAKMNILNILHVSNNNHEIVHMFWSEGIAYHHTAGNVRRYRKLL